MAYGNFKDLARRTASGKFFRNKAFNIAKNPKYVGYQRGLASMVHKFFDKKLNGGTVGNIEVNLGKQSAKELYKPFIRTSYYSGFKDNIWVLI